MPLYAPSLPPSAGIWIIEESEDALLSFLSRRNEYATFLAGIKNEGRRREWLAVRVLLKTMLGREVVVEYEPGGAPRIAGRNDISISISHTRGYAAVSVGKNGPAGIDIEYRSDRALKVSARFLHPVENEFINPLRPDDHVTACWCVKEAMYKIIGKGDTDFGRRFRISPFPLEDAGVVCAVDTRNPGRGAMRFYYRISRYFVMACFLDSSVMA
ncbi:MAG: 4'-phosphopantetheinyl transferase superfamily protein [Tannerellaceae bacterium]|jgi:phosphopantetheinyl transferase|nr:4'-phosphopantetheinyl transferase superfamily protein [Tannerellaceae bacterium]